MNAVIFDMDGVLTHTEHLHRQATTEALKLYGIERKKSLEMKLRGRPLVESMEAIVEHYKVQDSIDEFSRKRREIFYRILSENDIAMPGVLDLIKKLREKKVKIALGTSATRDYADFAIKKLKLEKAFSAVSTVDDVLHGKPSPDIYLKAAEMLSESPKNCIVIEDADLGIEAAKKAGMKVIGFKSPESHGETLENADYIISSFKEFNFDWLK